MRITNSLFLAMFAIAYSFAATGQDRYAQHLAITPAPGNGLQKLELPAQVLIGLQTPGYRDVRILNADQQAVPMALTQVGKTQTQGKQIGLKPYPLMDADSASELEGLSIRIEQGKNQSVVHLNTQGQTAASEQAITGVLLDARLVTEAVSAIELQANLPHAQAVSMRLQASKDLKSWRTLADSVFYRFDDAEIFTSARFQFSPVSLKDHYLRILWNDVFGNKSTASVNAATLITADKLTNRPRQMAVLAEAKFSSSHEVSFALPFATQVAALEIKPQGDNALIPIRVLGRNGREQAWRQIASSVVFNMLVSGNTRTSTVVELSGAHYREFKLEADKRTSGFAAVPNISVLFEPVQIVFLPSGPAPFTLAFGMHNADNVYLELPSLIPDYEYNAEKSLPLARLSGGSDLDANALVKAKISDQSMPLRSMVLWAVLIGAVLALAALAWMLMRQMKKP